MKFFSKFLAISALLCAATVFTANARILYVRDYIPLGPPPNGSSWANAFTDLEDVLLNRVHSRDTIWVAAGTYRPTTRSFFTMAPAVAIYGGFPATPNAATTWAQRNWVQNLTILEPRSGSSSNVIFNNRGGLTATAVLDGFIIQNGNATNGGGIYNNDASPTIRNCTITNCTATSNGGGIYNEWSTATFINCTITNCTATNGGGMYNYDEGSPTITNCTIDICRATNGGGMYNVNHSSPIINNNCQILDCHATNGNGGGIYSTSNSSPTISSCSISGCTASNNGGGIYQDGGALSGDFFVHNNSANNNGGGIYLNNAVAQLDCTSAWNNTTNNGGGIYNNGSNVTVLRLSTYYNTAAYGGGIYNIGRVSYAAAAGALFLVHHNNVSQDGGGIYNDNITCSWGGDMLVVANTANGYGGGIYNTGGNNIFNDCSLTSNTATNGGGVYNNNATVSFFGFVSQYPPYIGISNNIASKNGGGMYNINSTVTIDNQLFEQNEAKDKDGGAIYNNQSQNLSIGRCEFVNNAALCGGAIATRNSRPLSVRESVFDRNSAYGNTMYYPGYGGAIYSIYTPLVIETSTFTKNLANNNGGAISTTLSTDFIYRSQFYENRAVNGGGIYFEFPDRTSVINCHLQRNGGNPAIRTNYGGALYCEGQKMGQLDLENLLITDNEADNGAGIYNISTEIVMLNLTIANNRGDEGSGIYSDNNSMPNNGSIKCLNTIIWGNIGTMRTLENNISNINPGLSSPHIGFSHCDIEGSQTQGWDPNLLGGYDPSSIDQDPEFVDPWNFPFNDFHLRDHSPCIGAGDNSYVNSYNLRNDLDGGRRIVGYNVDMGCYENPEVWWRSAVSPVSDEAETTTVSALPEDVKIYPNPVIKGGSVNVEVNLPAETAITAILCNSLGQQIQQVVFVNGHNEITLPETSGIYWLKLIGAGGQTLKTEKIIVQ